jgi:hypothetical protein
MTACPPAWRSGRKEVNIHEMIAMTLPDINWQLNRNALTKTIIRAFLRGSTSGEKQNSKTVIALPTYPQPQLLLFFQILRKRKKLRA